MAKKVPVSSGGMIYGRYNKSGQTYDGGNALETDHYIANDGKGVLPGTANARYLSTKPTDNSGSVGRGIALKADRGGKELRGSDVPKGGRVYRSTKPKR